MHHACMHACMRRIWLCAIGRGQCSSRSKETVKKGSRIPLFQATPVACTAQGSGKTGKARCLARAPPCAAASPLWRPCRWQRARAIARECGYGRPRALVGSLSALSLSLFLSLSLSTAWGPSGQIQGQATSADEGRPMAQLGDWEALVGATSTRTHTHTTRNPHPQPHTPSSTPPATPRDATFLWTTGDCPHAALVS